MTTPNTDISRLWMREAAEKVGWMKCLDVYNFVFNIISAISNTAFPCLY